MTNITMDDLRLGVKARRVGTENDPPDSRYKREGCNHWKVTNMDDVFEPDQGYFDWENALWCAKLDVFPLGTILQNVKTGRKAVVSKGYNGNQLKRL